MGNFMIVGLGGALGATCRYSISLIPIKMAFPVLTLLTNLLGAIIIGFFVGLSTNGVISDEKTLFWKTGVCGGFTTFSTFSLEALNLFEDGKLVTGGLYVVLSVGLCVAGVMIGRNFSKMI